MSTKEIQKNAWHAASQPRTGQKNIYITTRQPLPIGHTALAAMAICGWSFGERSSRCTKSLLSAWTYAAVDATTTSVSEERP
mmetsp:Transcript_3284/g.6573  ORF Transcript_3284/g.6573 Transcript_3284/m.6573 type:complete len:82 (-) Transcript_3284:1944-2189(-)